MGGTVSHKISHEFPSNCVTRGAGIQTHTFKIKIQRVILRANMLKLLIGNPENDLALKCLPFMGRGWRRWERGGRFVC